MLFRSSEAFEHGHQGDVVSRVRADHSALHLQGYVAAHPDEGALYVHGKTVSLLTIEKEIIGVVTITDRVKTSTVQALQELQDLGVEIVMLTGDNSLTAAAIAKEIGISNYKAGMLPQNKQAEVARLQAEGKIVAMAGDGINDAPALAQANVGIAMGTGTDIAIESAEITLVKGDLNGIVKAKKLSKAVMKNIWRSAGPHRRRAAAGCPRERRSRRP